MLSIGWPRTAVGRWRLILLGAAAALSAVILLQPPPWEVFARAAGKMRVADYAVAYTSIAAALNILLLAALALICPWWARAPAPEMAPGTASRGATPRWFWTGLLAAAVVFTGLTVPRLTQSLWDDEETTVRFYVVGRHKWSLPQGELRFKPVPWRDTFFAYDTPNNHVFHNVLARLSNAVWHAADGAGGLPFKEWALRLPAFLAGLATLVVSALLLKDLAMPWAGVLGAWLLALHPWFGKYAAEARGYTLVMAFVCSAVLFWRRALLTGRWLWWALFAITQALSLWTWPGALFFFVFLNLGAVLVLSAGAGCALPRRTCLSRWFCCSALAAFFLIQFMLPLVPQMKSYLEQAPKMSNAAAWFASAACHLATGAPWAAARTQSEGRAEIRSAAKAAPGTFTAASVAGAVLLAWGAARLVRSGQQSVLVVVAAILGVIAVQAWEIAQANMFVFVWYLAYLLPFLAAALAAGLSGLAATLARTPFGRVTAPAAIAAVFLLFVFVTQPARARGLASATEPVREAVLLTRPSLDPAAPENKKIITVGITDPAFVYDPRLIWARSSRDLVLLCLQADACNRPLRLNLGHLWLIRENNPRLQSLIDDPAFFTGHRTLRSEFPHCDRMVCYYIPGAASKADLSRHLDAESIAMVRQSTSLEPEVCFAK